MKRIFTSLILIVLGFINFSAFSQDFTQRAKLVGSNNYSSDEEGTSVAIDGNYAIVGAPKQNYNLSGPFNGNLNQAGGAYIYEVSGGIWTEVQQIQPADRGADDYFGQSISISGDYAAIGAYRADSDTGAVYIFKRDGGGVWQEQQKLISTDAAAGDYFGQSVSINSNYVLIGASEKNGAEGAAYVFIRSGSTWTQQAKLLSSDIASNDEFGFTVSLSGSKAIIGAPYEDEDEIGINTMSGAGSAYMFERSGATWSQISKIVSSDRAGNDRFGYSVAVSSNYAVVGAPEEDHDELGMNSMSGAGSAYVFEKSGTWTEVQKVVASDRAGSDKLGFSVAIKGNLALVGAYWEDHDEMGMNSKFNAGSAYIYERSSGGVWNENQKLVSYDRGSSDNFGNAVGFGSNYAIVGAYKDGFKGSAYIYKYCATSTSSIAVDSACSSYIWRGNTYTASGIYRDTITPNSFGCDSFLILDLKIKTSSFSFSELSCGNYTSPSGLIWDSTGTYFDTIQNVALCDSFITVNLIVKNNSDTILNINECQYYIAPSGDSLIATGQYIDTIPNVELCDSLITINLTIASVDNSVTIVGGTMTANAVGVTYQWFDCSSDTQINGETGQTFSPTTIGSYAVIVTEVGCTSDTSDCSIVASISDVDLQNLISIYPNPISDNKLIIDFGYSFNGIVEIVDILGKTLIEKVVNNKNSKMLNLNFEPGIYLVKIIDKNGSETVRKFSIAK